MKGALLGKLEDRFFKHKSHKRFFCRNGAEYNRYEYKRFCVGMAQRRFVWKTRRFFLTTKGTKDFVGVYYKALSLEFFSDQYITNFFVLCSYFVPTLFAACSQKHPLLRTCYEQSTNMLRTKPPFLRALLSKPCNSFKPIHFVD